MLVRGGEPFLVLRLTAPLLRSYLLMGYITRMIPACFSAKQRGPRVTRFVLKGYALVGIVALRHGAL